MIQVMNKPAQAAKDKNLSRALTASQPSFLAIGSAGVFKPEDEEEHLHLIQVESAQTQTHSRLCITTLFLIRI
jgi:hypothetical protein